MNPELATYEALAKEILRRCMAEEDPADIRTWIGDTIARISGDAGADAVMTWEDSFLLTEAMIDEYERIANIPADQRKVLEWPWESWRKLIDPLEDGVLGGVAGP